MKYPRTNTVYTLRKRGTRRAWQVGSNNEYMEWGPETDYPFATFEEYKAYTNGQTNYEEVK
jgi:hypothetical protein